MPHSYPGTVPLRTVSLINYALYPPLHVSCYIRYPPCCGTFKYATRVPRHVVAILYSVYLRDYTYALCY